MIAIHIEKCGSFMDILFEGEVVSLFLELTFNPSRLPRGGLDEALEFAFENAEHYEKEEILSASSLPTGWFDPDIHIDNVKEFHEGQEEYDKLLQLMIKACL